MATTSKLSLRFSDLPTEMPLISVPTTIKHITASNLEINLISSATDKHFELQNCTFTSNETLDNSIFTTTDSNLQFSKNSLSLCSFNLSASSIILKSTSVKATFDLYNRSDLIVQNCREPVDVYNNNIKVSSSDSNCTLSEFSGYLTVDAKNSSTVVCTGLALDRFDVKTDDTSITKLEVELLENNSFFSSSNPESKLKISKILSFAVNLFIKSKGQFFKFILQEREGYAYSPTIVYDSPTELTKHNMFIRKERNRRRWLVVVAVLVFVVLSDDFVRENSFHKTYYHFKFSQKEIGWSLTGA